MEHEELIDRVYEASAVPELWGEIVERLVRLVDAKDGLISMAQPNADPRITVARTDHFVETWDLVFSRYPAGSNERVGAVLREGVHGFITDQDVFTPEQLRTSPLYTEILVPRGYGAGVATSMSAPGCDPVIVNLERPVAEGRFDRRAVGLLNGVRPHLARAFTVASQLALKCARDTAQTLEVLGLPAAVLDRNLRLRAANPRFEGFMPGTVLDGVRRMQLTDERADRMFAADAPNAGGGGRSIPVRREDELPLILHMVPLRRAAHDVFGGGDILVVLTPLAGGQVPSTQLLEGLFDLTPSEARVARAIGQGLTVEDVAAAQAGSPYTVRTHLKSIFLKTGTGRQAELVRLLAGGMIAT